MRKLLFFFCIAICPMFCYSQEVVSKKSKMEWVFSSAIAQPIFQGNNFLSNDYSVKLGYYLSGRARFGSLPGLGFYISRNSVDILDSMFLGDFFQKSRFQETGVFIYYPISLHSKVLLEPRFGFGKLTAINIDDYDRFRLFYNNFFTNVNFIYNLGSINQNSGYNLIAGVNYGDLNGNQIVINQFDKDYIQKSKVLMINFGIELIFF